MIDSSVLTSSLQICSLRCGGQSLNLTCANRTIMVDLWWNLSVEAQATARVYRIGQQKETYWVRILAEDSVDQKLHDLQESKIRVIQNAFQEFEANKGLDKKALYKLLGFQPDNEGENEALSDDDTDEEDSYDDEFDDTYYDD